MDYKKEAILFVVQVLILIGFTFILRDVFAALIVSFLSRPLTKLAIEWFEKNLERRKH